MIATCEMTQQAEEARLVARCRAGDRDALAQVFAHYERVIFRYAFYMLGHREDALDVQQETFLRAFQALPTFRGEARLQTWLLKICTNLCRSHLRSQRAQRDRQETFNEDLIALETADPYHVVARSEEYRLLRIALQSLPPGERELILLHEYEEMNHAEIGVILGCAPVTVRVKLFRARRRLQERVESLEKRR